MKLGLSSLLAISTISTSGYGEITENELFDFLGEERFDKQKLFDAERNPNIVVSTDGTVLATWGEVEDNFKLGAKGIRVRRSENGGTDWGELITVTKPCWHGGGVIVNEVTGEILIFAESRYPPANISVHRSTDNGKTWKKNKDTIFHTDKKGNLPSMHFAEHGITLRKGKNVGRLIRAARWYAGADTRANLPKMYNTSIYSDDRGKTWKTSEPFPELGTGEGAITELSDGRLYYNSRRHWDPDGKNYDASRRWSAWSYDSGLTWKDASICNELPDGAVLSIGPGSGCLAGLARIPIKDKDIILYTNCDSPTNERKDLTVWASFDGAKTWPIKRQIHHGPSAYSSICIGRKDTASEGWIYVLFEGGTKHRHEGGYVARFNLSWLLQGKTTGDGKLPAWIKTKEQKTQTLRIRK